MIDSEKDSQVYQEEARHNERYHNWKISQKFALIKVSFQEFDRTEN